jgi:hypothetical protein
LTQSGESQATHLDPVDESTDVVWDSPTGSRFGRTTLTDPQTLSVVFVLHKLSTFINILNLDSSLRIELWDLEEDWMGENRNDFFILFLLYFLKSKFQFMCKKLEWELERTTVSFYQTLQKLSKSSARVSNSSVSWV